MLLTCYFYHAPQCLIRQKHNVDIYWTHDRQPFQLICGGPRRYDLQMAPHRIILLNFIHSVSLRLHFMTVILNLLQINKHGYKLLRGILVIVTTRQDFLASGSEKKRMLKLSHVRSFDIAQRRIWVNNTSCAQFPKSGHVVLLLSLYM